MNVSKTLNYLKNGGIYVVLFILLMIIIIKEPSFLSLNNFSNILVTVHPSPIDSRM